MNVTNLKAAAEVASLTAEQGWTNKTYTVLLSDFITLNQLWPQVLEYMKTRVDDDNEEELL